MNEHTLNQVSSHVYWFSPDDRTDRPALGVIAGDDGTLLVDAGNSVAHIELLLAALSRHELANPNYALLTHSHWDHASDSTILYVPEDKILFLSDCLSVDIHHGPFKYTTAKLFPLINEILSYEVEYYIWGHRPEPMPKDEMVKFTNILRAIGEAVDKSEGNRERIVHAVQGSSSEPLDAEQNKAVDAFLAGL